MKQKQRIHIAKNNTVYLESVLVSNLEPGHLIIDNHTMHRKSYLILSFPFLARNRFINDNDLAEIWRCALISGPEGYYYYHVRVGALAVFCYQWYDAQGNLLYDYDQT